MKPATLRLRAAERRRSPARLQPFGGRKSWFRHELDLVRPRMDHIIGRGWSARVVQPPSGVRAQLGSCQWEGASRIGPETNDADMQIKYMQINVRDSFSVARRADR